VGVVFFQGFVVVHVIPKGDTYRTESPPMGGLIYRAEQVLFR